MVRRLVLAESARRGDRATPLGRDPSRQGRELRGVPPAMNDVTRILSAIEHGDPRAADELLPLVYHELRRLGARRLAHEAPAQTLQATALAHGASLRLPHGDQARRWDSRGHFFAAAAE